MNPVSVGGPFWSPAASSWWIKMVNGLNWVVRWKVQQMSKASVTCVLLCRQWLVAAVATHGVLYWSHGLANVFISYCSKTLSQNHLILFPIWFPLLQNMLGWTKTSFHALLSTSPGLRTILNNWPYVGCYAVWAHTLNSEHAHRELGTVVN